MHLCRRLSLLTIVLVPLSPLAAADTAAVVADRHGDSLPVGAIVRLGSTRLRHADDIVALAFSPDGKTLASGSGDGQLSLWDAASGKELQRIQGDAARGISLLAFSPDGKLMAFTEAYAKSIHLCDPATGKVIHEVAGQVPVDTLAFSPDGRLLAWAGEEETGHLWDITAGKEVGRLDDLGKSIAFLAFMPDGKDLVVGTQEDKTGVIRIWDLAARKEKHRFQVRLWELHRCVLSPDGTFLAFTDLEGGFPLREVASGKEIRRIGKKSRSQQCPWLSILLSPDGKALAELGPVTTSSGFEGMVRLWDIATGKQVGQLQGPWGGGLAPGCAAFSPDSKVLAVSGTDHAVHLFDLATGKERFQDGGLLGGVAQVAFSPDGKLLATASLDGVRLWDAAGKELFRLPTPEGGFDSALAFTGDGKRLVFAGTEALHVWDVATAKELRQRKAPEGNWWAIGLSGDAEVLALGGPYQPWLLGLEVDTGKTRWRLDYSQHAVSCLALSPQGESLAVVAEQGIIHLWDLKEEKRRHQIPGNEPASNGPSNSRLAFSADGKTLASQRPKDGVQLWDAATGKERLRLKDPPAKVISIAFAPNGRLFACGTADGAVGLWDAATGERLYHGRGHRGAVDHLAFAANSKVLLSGSADTTALLWDVARLLPQRTEK